MEFLGVTRFDWFAALEPSQQEMLHSITKTVTMDEGAILFFAGERPSYLHLVADGLIEIYKHDSEGNEIPLATFGAGSMIAEMATFENIPYPATARCKTKSVIYKIDFELFKRNLLSNQAVALKIIASMSRKIKTLEAKLQQTLIDDAATKLARFLLEHQTELPKITQREIARQLSITPETVSRILNKFKQNGIVKTEQKKLYLIEPMRLHEMV